MAANAPVWENRIVGRADVPPDQLLANPKNYRRHTREQKNAFRGLVNEVGYIDPVLCTTDGTVIDGHLRVEVALEDGIAAIPVDYYDGTEAQADLILATKDPLAAMAYHDAENLRALLETVSTEDAAVQAMLDELAAEARTETIAAGLTDPDAVPAVPDEPTTKPGDLWLLGRHRLLCGDATVVTDVERLMDGERADLVWTDPPYGVAIGDKNRWLDSVAGSSDGAHLIGTKPKSSKRITSNLVNDTIAEGPLLQLLRDAFANAAMVCTAGAAWYVAAPAGPLHLLFGQALNELGIWRQTIQWVKNNATFAPLGVTYHWQAEPIFYGWAPGAAHNDFTDRKQTTVWQIDRPVASPDHPTTKPVELVTRAIEHSTKPGAVVLDTFCGSGTTLIACEQTHRDARLIEIDPHYCDVIIRRFEEHTGQTATLADRVMAAP